jgi:hypothetical protein
MFPGAAVAVKKPFIGVMYAKVERIRRETNGVKTDVHYTPITAL